MNQSVDRQTSKSIFRNVIYGSLTWILPLGLNFIATPIIVRSLGNSDYGIYALILGFVSYSFTFNFGRAVTKYIAEFRISGEPHKIREVISVSFFLNIIVGLFGVLVMCLSANWLVRTVFQIEPGAQEKTVTAIYIASSIIFFWMLSQVFTSVLQGIQRFDIYSKLFTANSFALTIGNLALVYCGFGLLALLAWNATVLFIFFIVFAHAGKSVLPEFGVELTFNRETVRLVLGYSASIVAYQVLANVLLLFERGWITSRLGTEQLTYYVIPMSLGLYLQAFVSSFIQVIFPLASELKNEREKLLRLYLKATKVLSMFVVFVVASVFVEGTGFLRLWMGETFAINSAPLLLLHITCFALIAIMSVSWQMAEGLGFPQINAVTTGVATVIGIALMLILTQDLGNYGVAAARLAGFTVAFLSIFVIEKLFFGHVQLRFWGMLTTILGIAAGTAALVEYLAASFLSANWGTFLISVFLGATAYCGVLLLLNFVTADEKLLLKRVLGR